jgi:tripartite motif-containing protein 71
MRPLLFLITGLCLFISCKPQSNVNASESRAPVKVPVRLSFEREISGKLLGFDLKRPSGLAVDPQQDLFIVDAGNHRLIKLDKSLEPVKDYGGFGAGIGRFNNPSDVTIDRGLNLYLLDAGNHRVVRLDINLNYVDAIQPEDDPRAVINNQGLLTGVVVSPIGEITVADSDNSRLIRLDNFNRFSRYIGDFSYGKGALQTPLRLAIDRDGELFAADAGNARIAVYDDYGNFLHAFGADTLNYPASVCAAPNGIIWVGDQQLNLVMAFSSDGRLLFSTADAGGQADHFSHIEAITSAPDDLLYLADSGNNRVMVYRILYEDNR